MQLIQLMRLLERREPVLDLHTEAVWGLDVPVPDALRVVEEVARHDGSTAWVVALGLADGAFTSMLPEASVATLLETVQL
jgi:hypothetical protein